MSHSSGASLKFKLPRGLVVIVLRAVVAFVMADLARSNKETLGLPIIEARLLVDLPASCELLLAHALADGSPPFGLWLILGDSTLGISVEVRFRTSK
eukprot:CAMPEP_0206549190 /NCGR_PEP_ID=MMETSP0325_2-20121206/14318_1 /ASSEMBLY_ACC=CAM_ASM_000347 /TAXON_ID=2866 /ORGANISM="Crypthecodinium cohnii, Strain Seligo" /LENGTH=96 /DNA_ID=CAMNT_0054048787 /DNA_START=108 /DNA_END=395 /DNA_ORIENTATION=+